MITAFVVGVVAELGCDLLAQFLAAGTCVRGKPDLAANTARLRDNVGIGNLVCDAERYECGRVRVDNRAHSRAHLVDRLVERILRRGFVRTDDRTVRFHADDVPFGERSLVDRTRGDPHIAVVVHDRDVSARGGRHATAIDAADDHLDLFGRVHQLGV